LVNKNNNKMILLDYFTYGIFRFFCCIGKNEDDAKLLAVVGTGVFLAFATSTIYAIFLIRNEVLMNANVIKYKSVRIGLWTGLVVAILCAIKYYWITSKSLIEIDKKYKQFSVLKRTIVRCLLIFIFTLIPVSLFLIYRYVDANF